MFWKLPPFDGLKRWYQQEKGRIGLFFGIFLALCIAFQAGRLQGGIPQSEPLIIALPPVPETSVQSVAEVKGEQIVLRNQNVTPEKCAFVGSRNSDKYHLPHCASAKRIKPENLVCFVSKEDAEKRGYVAGCLK